MSLPSHRLGRVLVARLNETRTRPSLGPPPDPSSAFVTSKGRSAALRRFGGCEKTGEASAMPATK